MSHNSFSESCTNCKNEKCKKDQKPGKPNANGKVNGNGKGNGKGKGSQNLGRQKHGPRKSAGSAPEQNPLAILNKVSFLVRYIIY